MKVIANKDANNILPLVSVMMPVYNGEKTIELAIKSLLLQTYTNWRCVIVNDCSTDRTAEILRKYENDQRFKIIHLSKNVGRGAARQIALDNSEGKYMAYLDADDFYHSEKLEIQVNYLELNNDVALITSGQGSFDDKYELRAVRGKGKGDKLSFEQSKGLNGSFAGSMIRLDEGSRLKYNLNLKASEDRDYIWRYLENHKFCVLNDVLYYYFEIGPTNSNKILTYQIQTLKLELSQLRITPFYSIKRVFVTVFKLIGYVILLPVLGADRIVLRRGIKPSESEIDKFSNVKENLLIN